jgi:hypothetical protein
MRTAQCTSNPSQRAEKRRSLRSRSASELSGLEWSRDKRAAGERELRARRERRRLGRLVAALKESGKAVDPL